MLRNTNWLRFAVALVLVGGLAFFLTSKLTHSYADDAAHARHGGHVEPSADEALPASFFVSAPAVTNVAVQNTQFTPANIVVPRGTTVHWVWQSGAHSTTSGFCCTPDGVWDSDIRVAPDSFDHVFDSAGSFPYYCEVHGAVMTGSVTVTTATAAGVTVSGHVTNGNGRAIREFTISMTDEAGAVLRRRGDQLGAYSFSDVAPGHTYVIQVSSKGFQFAPRVETVNDNLAEINFVPEDAARADPRSKSPQ